MFQRIRVWTPTTTIMGIHTRWAFPRITVWYTATVIHDSSYEEPREQGPSIKQKKLESNDCGKKNLELA